MMAMNPYKAIRNRLGLSSREMGSLMGLDATTIRRYEMPETASTRLTPHPCAKILYALLGKGIVAVEALREIAQAKQKEPSK